MPTTGALGGNTASLETSGLESFRAQRMSEVWIQPLKVEASVGAGPEVKETSVSTRLGFM